MQQKPLESFQENYTSESNRDQFCLRTTVRLQYFIGVFKNCSTFSDSILPNHLCVAPPKHFYLCLVIRVTNNFLTFSWGRYIAPLLKIATN